MTNLNTAFDVAEKYLDIPKMLDAEGERRRKTAEEIILIFSVMFSDQNLLLWNSSDDESKTVNNRIKCDL